MGLASQPQSSPKPEYWHYDHVLSPEQKEVLNMRLEKGHDGMLLHTIEDMCEEHHIDKERFLDYACKIFDVSNRTKNQDYRHIAEFQYREPLVKQFGKTDAYFIIEHIMIPLQSYIFHSITPYHEKNTKYAKAELIENLLSNHANEN